MLLFNNERALWRYDNAFLFTNQSGADFGIALVYQETNLQFAQSGCTRVFHTIFP